MGYLQSITTTNHPLTKVECLGDHVQKTEVKVGRHKE